MHIPYRTKKSEAIRRMRKFGMNEELIKQFKDDKVLLESEPPFGSYHVVEDDVLDRVREFEKQYNACVYFIIHSITDIGELENYLFVSDYDEEWLDDEEDVENGQVVAYVLNKSMPECSEMGYIGVEVTLTAGLWRTW